MTLKNNSTRQNDTTSLLVKTKLTDSEGGENDSRRNMVNYRKTGNRASMGDNNRLSI